MIGFDKYDKQFHEHFPQMKEIHSGKWFVVFVDIKGNMRRTNTSLLSFEKKLVGEKRLFWTMGTKKDKLILKTNKGNQTIWLSSIPDDDVYTSHLKVFNEVTKEDDWTDGLTISDIENPRLKKEDRMKKKIEKLEDIEVNENDFKKY